MSLTIHEGGLLCNKCIHKEVCQHKEDYTDAYNAIFEPVKNIEFVCGIKVDCRYFQEKVTITATTSYWCTEPINCDALGTAKTSEDYTRGITTCLN